MLPAVEALPPEEFERLLLERGPRFGIELSPPILVKLARFLAELDLARRRTNLTGPLSGPELVDHALESALGAPLLPPSILLVDVGSGAGFPGLPLAIVRPDIRVTPVEPRRKRADFLKRAAQSVPIENASVVAARVAQIAPDVADAVCARAVGGIEKILGDAAFLKPGGAFLAWTTDASQLAGRLAALFELESTTAVPESRLKVIAAFRKADVPRGTSL